MGATCVILTKYVNLRCLQLRVQVVAITIMKHSVYIDILKLRYTYTYAQYIDIRTPIGRCIYMRAYLRCLLK